MGTYLYNVPLYPSRPADFVFYIRSSCCLTCCVDMLNGIGSLLGGAPSNKDSEGRGDGEGNKDSMYYSHYCRGCIEESVRYAGSKSFQKLAGLYCISCLAHFVKFSIYWVFDVCHIWIKRSLRFPIYCRSTY